VAFQITGLSSSNYNHLFELDENSLKAQGMRRVTANSDFGYPDRVSLMDAKVGATLILLNYHHQNAPTPFNATGPIFVGRGEGAAIRVQDEVPESLSRRVLSLRAYDEHGMMEEGVVIDGAEFEHAVEALFARQNIAYIHAHYASRGCYAARIDRSQV
jgi:hypothetical protein